VLKILKETQPLNMETKSQIFKNVKKSESISENKVTIVGSGAVATAIAISILAKGISKDVAIIGRNEDIVHGEVVDLTHGARFLDYAKVTGGNQVSHSKGSKLIIFAAGSRIVKSDEDRLDMVKKNVEVVKTLVPALVQLSPDCVMLMVTDPVEVMTHVAWKVSGLPYHRVLGSGTHLDTARFQKTLAEKLDIPPRLVDCIMIGEHGEYSIPIWSSINIAGRKLVEINPRVTTEHDREDWIDCHEKARKIAEEVVNLKGYESFGIALSCADIAAAVINNSNEIKTVSTLFKGFNSFKKEVFLSLPCVINSTGVSSIIDIALSIEDRNKFIQSANHIEEIQKTFSY
jgi:L-lactate dehydrogenase